MHRSGFIDRHEAGELLAHKLEHYRGTDALVLAIPRGGIAVGHALARELGLTMDVLFAKKIGHTGNRELAIGAVSIGSVILDHRFDIPKEYVEHEVARIRATMKERMALYRGNRRPVDLHGRTVILVDDGVATGNTLLATMDLVRHQKPAHLVVAMPVVPADFVAKGTATADEFIYLLAPRDFSSVGQFYEEFMPVEDEDAVSLLRDNWKTTAS